MLRTAAARLSATSALTVVIKASTPQSQVRT